MSPHTPPGHTPPGHTLSPYLSDAAAHALLGLSEPALLEPRALAQNLRVSFFPRAQATPRVAAFARRLEQALLRWGARVLPYAEAPTGRPGERLVLITAGEATTGDLSINHVQHLRFTTMVTLLDGPCPAEQHSALQARLDAVVGGLAWHCAQCTLFVEDDRWTFCTMNGAIVRFSVDDDLERAVLDTLVPKLAAPVVPPHAADFDLRHGALSPDAPELRAAVEDLAQSAPDWAATGLLLYHTPIASLQFRGPLYARIVTAYLDHRTGMSYGFLARQLPTPAPPARTLAQAEAALGRWDWEAEPVRVLDDRRFVCVHALGQPFVVEAPDVRVLTTRSGCDKARVDPRRDTVVLGLERGTIVVETPEDAPDSKPSYDTRTILANAVANAVVAQLLAAWAPEAPWVVRLSRHGAGQAHWHGTLHAEGLPPGYAVHGADNPPVSCSTPQSALFALGGKLEALHTTAARGEALQGDVHIEPHHGVNVTGPSLSALAARVRAQQARGGVVQFW